MGQRRHRGAAVDTPMTRPAKRLRYDRSPWVAEPHAGREGISDSVSERPGPFASRGNFEDDLADVQSARWVLRNDTFPGDLGLFRPANFFRESGGGPSMAVRQEPLGCRHLIDAPSSIR